MVFKLKDERCYQTAISDFQNFENFGKLSIKILISIKNPRNFLNENCINLKEPCAGVYVYTVSSQYLEKWLTYAF